MLSVIIEIFVVVIIIINNATNAEKVKDPISSGSYWQVSHPGVSPSLNGCKPGQKGWASFRHEMGECPQNTLCIDTAAILKWKHSKNGMDSDM